MSFVIRAQCSFHDFFLSLSCMLRLHNRLTSNSAWQDVPQQHGIVRSEILSHACFTNLVILRIWGSYPSNKVFHGYTIVERRCSSPPFSFEGPPCRTNSIVNQIPSQGAQALGANWLIELTTSCFCDQLSNCVWLLGATPPT